MQTVLITGCSSGIGRATARAFLEAEWQVFATARNPDDVGDLGGTGCKTAALDVTDDGQVTRVVDRIVSDTGRIDCLVNNAGYAQFGPVEDLPVAVARRQFDVNLHGPHRLVRAVLPHMRERATGTIINISSVAGRVAFPGGSAYAGSKFGLEAMSDALRAEVARFGIDVVVVEPGTVETRFHDRARDELATGLERTDAYDPLYRLLEDSRLVGGQGPFAIGPAAVADVILTAATSSDPKPRYPVGPLARWTMWARFLPDRWRDRVFRLADRLLG